MTSQTMPVFMWNNRFIRRFQQLEGWPWNEVWINERRLSRPGLQRKKKSRADAEQGFRS
jgi:hypothetical protein